MRHLPPPLRQNDKAGDEAARDRRPKRRRSTLLAGIVVHLDGRENFDCAISDLSASGARLTIPKNTMCPSQFFLINIPGRMTHVATTIWYRRGEAGVSFASTLPLARVSKPSLSFLTRAWLERATR